MLQNSHNFCGLTMTASKRLSKLRRRRPELGLRCLPHLFLSRSNRRQRSPTVSSLSARSAGELHCLACFFLSRSNRRQRSPTVSLLSAGSAGELHCLARFFLSRSNRRQRSPTVSSHSAGSARELYCLARRSPVARRFRSVTALADEACIAFSVQAANDMFCCNTIANTKIRNVVWHQLHELLTCFTTA